MTGPRPPHPEYEELISASLAGDLTDQERRRLDAHLDSCDACRGVLASFADGRRIVAGLRHVPVPRDLHARVRTGIATGRLAEVPWWRRPAVIFAGVGGGLAAVAGAMLALVILNQDPGPVGHATPTPQPSLQPTATASASVTPEPATSTPGPVDTLPPASAEPTGDAGPTPSEPVATPQPTPVPTAPEPDVYLGYTGPSDNRALVVASGTNGDTMEVAPPEGADVPSGPTIAAELSPDGQWLAHIVRIGESGLHEVRATRINEGTPSDDPGAPPPTDSPLAVGQTVALGRSLSADAFLEQLFWSSPRGAHLAYTLADPDTGQTDVWLFEPETGEPRQLTGVGNAYAASWVGDDATASSSLWISLAAERPVSYLYGFPFDAAGEPVDPAASPLATAEGVFQPLLNASGRFAIFWDGRMQPMGDDGEAGPWQFASAGQPYLAYHDAESQDVSFDSQRPVFRDLIVGRDGFTSASITWGADGDTYAIWDARWTGTPQSGADDEPYPDQQRVYFSRATDRRGMTAGQAIDAGDVPEDWFVVDVKVAPTGEHLVLTTARPLAGILDAPEADLLLVDRNFNDDADEVTTLAGEDDEFWWGPAAYDER